MFVPFEAALKLTSRCSCAAEVRAAETRAAVVRRAVESQVPENQAAEYRATEARAGALSSFALLGPAGAYDVPISIEK